MKTIEEIKNYFSMSVAPGLAQLDQERKKILLKILVVTVVCWSASIAAILSAIYFFVNESEGLGVLFGVVFSLPIIAWGLFYGRIKKSWRLDYKKKAVMPLIEYMDPYFKYEHSLSISWQEFFDSELYKSQRMIIQETT